MTQGGPGWNRFKKDPAKAEAIRQRTLEFQQQAIREVAERPSKAEMRRADGYPEPKRRK